MKVIYMSQGLKDDKKVYFGLRFTEKFYYEKSSEEKKVLKRERNKVYNKY